MATSLFKVFLSKEKENKWLNLMGSKGYKLISINDSKYSFEISEEHTYSYSVEYLGCSPRSEGAVAYFETLKEKDIFPVLSSGLWVYLCKIDGVINTTADAYKKNATCYFWRAFYMLFFAICGAIVCGYQAFAVNYLKIVGYDGMGMITKTYEMSKKTDILHKTLNVLRTIVNFLYTMLNKYFQLWTKSFGRSDAVAVISIVAPITLVLLVWGAIELEKYVSYRKAMKCALKEEQIKSPSLEIKTAPTQREELLQLFAFSME